MEQKEKPPPKHRFSNLLLRGKSLEFILLRPSITVPHFMAIHEMRTTVVNWKKSQVPCGYPAPIAVCVLLTSGFEWEWDDHFKSSGAFLSCDNRKVSFHSDYSCGTAAIRGTKELTDGQHFWEVMMTSLVYGTDMVGIILAVSLNGHENVYIFVLMCANCRPLFYLFWSLFHWCRW